MDASTLTLVPAGQEGPDAHHEHPLDGVRSLEGRITVGRSEQLPQRAGTEVQVGGVRGVVVALDEDVDGDRLGGQSLFLPQPGGSYLAVQTPPELGWSPEQLAQFAAGVRATDDAVTTRG